MMKRIPILLAATLAIGLSGCGDKWFGEPEKPPLPGKRVEVLDFEKGLRPDDAATNAGFNVGDIHENSEWPQAGGAPDHDMRNLALSSGSLKKIWSADIGEGSRSNLPLTAQPVLAGKSIFTLDTDSRLSSFDTESGKRRWQIDVRDPDEEDPVISGGIAYDSGTIYVTDGYDELLAVDAIKGEIKWRSKLSAPSRAAPTISGGRIFATTLNNSILALDPADGHVLWEFSGLASDTGLIGAASPAASNDMVVPVFSSGEIYALRAGNGSVAWSDNLSSALRLGGLSALSDIRGLPVINNNVAYAISFGGKMVAIDMVSGTRLWQKDISGAKTPWISGNRAYVISNEQQVVSFDKTKGTVLWVSQLARFKDKEDKTGPIIWTGPIMAGNRLMAFSSDGRVAEINPEKGTLIREWDNGGDIRISPVIAGKTLYLLTEGGTLQAYR